jgi:Methyltransferase domain
MEKKSVDKWQFGDFQTPDILAEQVMETLIHNHQLQPDVIIEPSCGKGAFIRAALKKFQDTKIIGFDINNSYVEEAKISLAKYSDSKNVAVYHADFFDTDWQQVITEQFGSILILGNPPWVTSSELSFLNSENLPPKSNFQNRRGIESITGSGNFDISEWMLLQYINWLSKREGMIAVLCKASVARKVVRQMKIGKNNVFSSHIYLIDAKAHFSAAVEACLLVLCPGDVDVDCKIYRSLNSKYESQMIGERDGLMLSNTVAYEKLKHLAGQDLRYLWRSGVKHDCAKVMELERVNDKFKNGIDEIFSLEEDYLYPLLKSSDIGNSRIESCRKVILITQRIVGEDTIAIQSKAPKTWEYLQNHNSYLAKRKSSIYKKKPAYSIFGIGSYTFKAWKIAISGLYKKLNFCLIGSLDSKPVIFDDTVNFLSFDIEEEARFVFEVITSQPALNFFESMIFWDEKRPITIDILRRLSIKAVAKEIGILDQYLYWASTNHFSSNGQLELSLSESIAEYKISM